VSAVKLVRNRPALRRLELERIKLRGKENPIATSQDEIAELVEELQKKYQEDYR